jgi:hypothetical protein
MAEQASKRKDPTEPLSVKEDDHLQSAAAPIRRGD